MALIDSLATTEELAKLFSDQSLIAAMLEFEVALARVQSRLGIVPGAAAEKIAAIAKPESFDGASLSRESLRSGTPGIPLVKALRKLVSAVDSDAANFVHWGATTQDVVDTALILVLKRARLGFEANLARLEKSLRELAEKHAGTVMLGRTLGQPAPPTTLGLKAAGWLGSISRARASLNRDFAAAFVVQFGGGSGTLAFLGDKGVAVARGLAGELGLEYPEAPWHAHRDRLASLMCACGVLAGTLGKMARDISLLSQAEVGELAESNDADRGGSSTMPHKQNPIGCVLTLAAAHRVPGLVATFLFGMTQEHERGIGNWQVEWPTVAGIVQSTGVAIESMAEVAEGLSVDAPRMRANVDATRGTVFAEKAMMLLAPRLGRDAAQSLLAEAAKDAAEQHRNLSEILAEIPDIAGYLGRIALGELETPELYLGSADKFREALLARAETKSPPKRSLNPEKE
jgi:3-carboxy-cis,cis-muconate cycloisomerase